MSLKIIDISSGGVEPYYHSNNSFFLDKREGQSPTVDKRAVWWTAAAVKTFSPAMGRICATAQLPA
jgi:hypothetical protein